MEKRVQLLDQELRENVSTIAESLQGQGAELKAQMQAGRSQHREELGSMYAELLAQFLQSTEVENLSPAQFVTFLFISAVSGCVGVTLYLCFILSPVLLIGVLPQGERHVHEAGAKEGASRRPGRRQEP
jgi:hypothetical protein